MSNCCRRLVIGIPQFQLFFVARLPSTVTYTFCYDSIIVLDSEGVVCAVNSFAYGSMCICKKEARTFYTFLQDLQWSLLFHPLDLWRSRPTANLLFQYISCMRCDACLLTQTGYLCLRKPKTKKMKKPILLCRESLSISYHIWFFLL
jgi:hypothetical protein